MFPKHLSVISPKISMFKVVNITFGLEGWPAEDYQEASASLLLPRTVKKLSSTCCSRYLGRCQGKATTALGLPAAPDFLVAWS